MTHYQIDAPRVLVLCSHSEESTWRRALGESEPLLCFATFGPMDAPEHLPAGSMRASGYGPHASLVFRD